LGGLGSQSRANRHIVPDKAGCGRDGVESPEEHGLSKVTYVEFQDKAGKMTGAAFARNVVEVFAYKIHTVLTDKGMAFADLPMYRDSPTGGSPRGGAHLRPGLHPQRHRARADQALSPVDQRPSRADEPHHQRRNG